LINKSARLWILLLALPSAALAQARSDSVKLAFSFDQDPAIYEESDYGEAPQVAIWLQDPSDSTVRTVYVTYRGARGDYFGKVECPVALPAWIAAWRREFGRTGFPTPRDPIPEAITGATSQTGKVRAEATVPAGKKYVFYLEMNVAGDFNNAYPFEVAGGVVDYHGNGQPSLIYRGEITAAPGDSSSPVPYGRTEQHQYTGVIIRNLDGLDSALKCLKNIKVVCEPAE
jgi:hypothetical protein